MFRNKKFVISAIYSVVAYLLKYATSLPTCVTTPFGLVVLGQIVWAKIAVPKIGERAGPASWNEGMAYPLKHVAPQVDHRAN